MFANQVIKSLQKEINLRQYVVSGLTKNPNIIEKLDIDMENERRGLKYLTDVKTLVENSVQYYLGDYDEWIPSLSKSAGKDIFRDIDVRLPFPDCTFSLTFNQKTVKAIVYAHYEPASKELADHIVISVSFKPPEENDWQHYLVTYTYFLHGSVKDAYPNNYQSLAKLGEEEKTNGNVLVTFYESDHISYQEKNKQLIIAVASIIEKALEFLQCRNASAEYVYMTKSKVFNKMPEKERSLFRYKVLKVLVPKSNKIHVYDKTSPPMNSMPVHLVSGTWRTYTEERPLFGKYSGRWWWQPYLKGKPENGFITKDYCIKQKKS